MKTDHPFEPASTPGRKPYRFPPGLYHLCVQKADVQSAPGARILRRVVKLVFAVFCAGPDGRLVRCAQDRIAAFVILVLTKDGTWAPLDEDRPLLAALGAPKSLKHADDVAEILSGHWIEGRPGPADPEGFNCLVDYRPIDPPSLGTPASSPPAATPPQKQPASDPLLSLDDPTFSLTWRGKTCFLGNNGSFKLLKLLESRRGEFIEDREIGEKCCRNEDLAEGPAIRQVKGRLVKCLRSNKMGDLADAIKRQLGHYGLIL